MSKQVMTLSECVEAMRAAGIPCSMRSVSDSLADGVYPFGRIKSVGKTGYRSFEIFRSDFERWLAGEGRTNIPRETARPVVRTDRRRIAEENWREANRRLLQCQSEAYLALVELLEANGLFCGSA